MREAATELATALRELRAAIVDVAEPLLTFNAATQEVRLRAREARLHLCAWYVWAWTMMAGAWIAMGAGWRVAWYVGGALALLGILRHWQPEAVTWRVCMRIDKLSRGPVITEPRSVMKKGRRDRPRSVR
jgi:hypothetical protein